MCGIFGMVALRGAVDAALLDAGTDRVAHRGPDGRGTAIVGNVGLGHRRLAIIDTSDAGLQPMRHAEQPLTVVYNGEVYNYLELRTELAAVGHRFRTGTDTEVLLAAYLEWGAACVQRFNGMWSFAILDERNGTLFCSRDRFGVKPFYWIETSDWFAFGSEIRQLLPLSPRRAAVGERVRDYLVSGLSDHTDQTFHAGIRQLDAGHNLIYDLAGQRHRIERYYALAPGSFSGGAAEAAGQLGVMLEDAVRLRLRSDVRVGTCLSGGLDSSSVACLASRMHTNASEPFHAITAISELEENSEEGYAASVVAAAGLQWVRVRPTTADFVEAIDAVVDTQEEPFGGPSVAMQHFVMRAARADGVTVLLDGQGADESLFGYDRHAVPWLRERLRAAGVSGVRRAAHDLLANNTNLSGPKLAAMLVGSYFPGLLRLAAVARLPGARYPARLPAAWSRYLESLADAAAVQLSDIQATSLPMLLRYEDRNSMRHAVEARLPFLDYRLVELTMRLGVDLKLQSGWSKWPLRAAMANKLPPEIVWRRRKLGFEAPDRLWLEALRPAMKDTVAGSRLLGELFDTRRLLAAFDRLERGLAWRVFCVAAWERRSAITELA